MLSRGRLQACARLVIGLGILSAACGGTTPEDPMAPFRSQKLNWAACDPTTMDAASAATVAALGDRVRCATLRAPLDYADPARGELSVAFLRVAAGVPAERVGAILFNPGGPGGDGIPVALLFAHLWTRASPDDPVAGPFLRMSGVYDLVGFSPRGTGSSTRLSCQGSDPLPFVSNPAADRSPANVAAMIDSGRMLAAACAANPLTRHMHTDATARDMDLFREVTGDAKLHYYGASYGTWLGTWYAALFPQRVGRMLLTGVVNLRSGLQETFLAMPRARQSVLDDVLAPYAARYPEAFGLGTDLDAIRRIHPGLPLHLQTSASELLSLGESAHARDYVLVLAAARGLQDLLEAHPDATEAEMRALVDAHGFVPDPALEPVAKEIAHALSQATFSKMRHDTQPVDLDGPTALQYAVVCNDEPPPRTLLGWIDQNDRDAALYPLNGGYWTDFPCGGNVVTRPPLESAWAAGGMLLLQTRRDPITSLEGALASLDALPAASMVEVIGDDFNHGLIVPYGSACVDEPVTAFFLHGTLPARRVECQGRELAAPGADAAPAGSLLPPRSLSAPAPGTTPGPRARGPASRSPPG
jgi:pimeloyl-ACP methyl ester carboxylesterase